MRPTPLCLMVLCLALKAMSGEAPAARSPLSRDALLFRLGAQEKPIPITTPALWTQRRDSILQAMESIMGPLPGPDKRCPLEVHVISEVDCGSYWRRELTYQADPKSTVPAYLLIPKAALLPGHQAPAVLTLHQTHPKGSKVVVGLGESPDDEYGVELAKRGYVCLAPPYPMLAEYWPKVRDLGYESGTMMAIWINIRGIDLLSSLPFVKTNGFGCIGHSLGGHNGIFTAAFDPRIRAVVSSCGLDEFRDYYGGDPRNWAPEKGWCQTRYMPRLAAYQGRLDQLPFDFPEIIASIAPRSVFISAPLHDSNFSWKSVDQAVATAREVFRLYQADSNLRVEHPDSPHRFPPKIRQQAYQFIDAALRRPTAP